MGIENIDFGCAKMAIIDFIADSYNAEFICDDFYSITKSFIDYDNTNLYEILKILEDLKIIKYVNSVGPSDCPDMFHKFELIDFP